MDKIDRHILETVADLHGIPQGAYNIRANGEMARVQDGTIRKIYKSSLKRTNPA